MYVPVSIVVTLPLRRGSYYAHFPATIVDTIIHDPHSGYVDSQEGFYEHDFSRVYPI